MYRTYDTIFPFFLFSVAGFSSDHEDQEEAGGTLTGRHFAFIASLNSLKALLWSISYTSSELSPLADSRRRSSKILFDPSTLRRYEKCQAGGGGVVKYNRDKTEKEKG